jgi:hypothetical protein
MNYIAESYEEFLNEGKIKVPTRIYTEFNNNVEKEMSEFLEGDNLKKALGYLGKNLTGVVIAKNKNGYWVAYRHTKDGRPYLEFKKAKRDKNDEKWKMF